MAEALTVAEAVIALAQISEQVISACYRYYHAVKDANREILHVINTVSSLKTTVDNLRLLLENPSKLRNLHGLEKPIKACQSTLEKLRTKLDSQFGTGVHTDNPKISFLQKLLWPWKKNSEMEHILATIEKQKLTFILALAADTLEETLDFRAEVMESFEAMAAKQLKITILNWLKLSDPSTNHLAAREKHEPTTGDWFLESATLFKWTKATLKSVWLRGIPGVGKTILCSTIIERVKELCSTQNNHRVAYFYFDFNDPNKRIVDGMLRSIITQLCAGMEELPEKIVTLYKHNGNGTQQPAKDSLIDVFVAIMSEFDRTYLIVDALDECGERQPLLDLISRLINSNLSESKIDFRILVTSRKEKGLAECLHCTFDETIELEGGGIDQDIECHVTNCLESDKGLQKWPHVIRLEIHDALVKGAHGMFRWVECQLDILKRCLTVQTVRKALSELPKTLDETYQRIIANIPEEYYQEALRVMQIMVVAFRPLTLEAVAEAMVIDDRKEIFDPECRMRDPMDILEICSSLVSVSVSGSLTYLQLSHYSVKEYLTSSRILTTTFSNFRISQPDAHQMVAKISLIYLLSFQKPFSDISEFSIAFFFLPYARTEWYRHLIAATQDSRTPEKDLVIRLFEPGSLPYRNFLGDLGAIVDGPHEILQSNQATQISGALWISSYLGLLDVVESLLLRGANIIIDDGQHWTCYPLMAAVYAGHEPVARLLLKYGANVHCRAVWVGYPLHVASREGRISMVRLLLEEGGADVNDLAAETRQNALHEAALNGHVEVAQLLMEHGINIDQIGGRCGTPLQAAAQCGSEPMVRLLLERGADVNLEGADFCSPLIAGTIKGEKCIVRLLLDYGANVNAVSRQYGTALNWALSEGNVEIIHLLRERGGEDVGGEVIK